ncbi:tRNA lysidine(34) synthetase TilS [Candidatus Pandoraea novymonadis]|nr:tRNA lysidine(34) synthetase TilS [Candidatus Pandoraea novymonadis]
MQYFQKTNSTNITNGSANTVSNSTVDSVITRIREVLRTARQSHLMRNRKIAIVDRPSKNFTSEPLRVALAMSGGLDSVVLLDALVCFAVMDTLLHITVFHIHHGLAAEADDWLKFCERETEMRDVAFIARRVQVPRRGKVLKADEAAARIARYDALAGLCTLHKVDVILTAHHANDQAETVLLQLLRGAGLPGVAAMPVMGVIPGQDNNPTMLLRPLLELPREILQEYAREKKLRWVEDPSNEDTHYLRNGLRHDVMPMLLHHFPASRETLGRFARHAAQAQSLLEQLAEIDWEMAYLEDGMLRRSAILGLNADRVANLLRYWVRRIGLPLPSEARLGEWVKQVRGAVYGASLELPHSYGVLRLYRDTLQWVLRDASMRIERSPPIEQIFRWQGEVRWHLPEWHGHIHFLLSKVGMPGVPEEFLREQLLTARGRVGGERWRSNVNGHSRSLRHWFQSKGVPVWSRQGPIIWMSDKIFFVPYLGIDASWLSEKGSPSERSWTIMWENDSSSTLPSS